MTFTLDGIELKVSELGIASPQKVAWVRLPAANDIAQDWGQGLKSFSLSGTFFRREGGLSQAFLVDGMKENREPVLLRIDSNSWMVQCQDFRYRLAGGVVAFDLEVTEVEQPEEFVFTADKEMGAAYVSEGYLALLRLKMQAFWWRGITDHVAEWITEAELRIADIQDWLMDVVSLVRLPAATLGNVARAAGIVSSRMGLLVDEVEQEFETEQRRYSDDEEVRKQALLLARSIRTQMALLVSACNAVPKAQSTYIVQDGDTLIRLTERWNIEHDASLGWTDVARANQLLDPGEIATGQELVMP